jgi:cysteine desulfurase
MAAVTSETALVNVQLANHEVGTLQPAAEVAAACRERGVLSHIDACTAAGHVLLDFAALSADLLSVTAHKLGGPQGVGALLVRRGLRLPPLLLGGAQERARRGGVENVAAIVGFGAAAAELAGDGRLVEEAVEARSQTERVLAEAPARLPGLEIFGDRQERVPHLVCLGVRGVEAEPVLLGLDQRGVAVHSGSSCSSETFEPSPVLRAMGVDADHSLRVSVGWNTTDDEVEMFLDALPEVVDRLRALRT